MFIARNVPIRSVQFVVQQMRHVDSVIQRCIYSFLPRIQEYTNVRAVPPLVQRLTDRPAGYSASKAALQTKNTKKSTRQTANQENVTGENTNSKSENSNVQLRNKPKSKSKKAHTDKYASTGRSTNAQLHARLNNRPLSLVSSSLQHKQNLN